MYGCRFYACLSTIVVLFAGRAAVANDAYYGISLDKLSIDADQLPDDPGGISWRERADAMRPYVILDQPGEAYLDPEKKPKTTWYENLEYRQWKLFARAAAGVDLSGRLVLPRPGYQGMQAIRFSLPASGASQAARGTFLATKGRHLERLLQRGVPGGAWFREQLRQNRRQLHLGAPDANPVVIGGRTTSEMDRTFDLFSGGRAIADNLQFDRGLPLVNAAEGTVNVDDIHGITIGEIDWKPLVKDLHSALDPLAALIPADQHALFFNSFQNLVAVADEANHQGTLLFRWLDPRSENELVQERYERQLGVSLSIAGRLLGPQLVKSAAITGSDPFFLAGTDVALLFESANAKALTAAMKAQIGLAADAQRVHAECARLDGVSYTFWRSPDRRMSAYLAELGGHVVLTNSPAQLARLSAVAQGKAACLAELSEYAFFRDRYPRGDAEETALLFISDPALRRWCGPRWRIADSRRIRAAARMSSILAEKLDSLGAQSTLDTAAALPAELAPFGSLAFLTPIAELDLRRVTRSEAEAYGRWRDGYQRNWNWKFDPIGVRLTVRPVKLGVDLTVMPLIANSQYDTYLDVARGAAIAPHAGDRHETLLHVALAVNRNSSNWRRLADIFTSTNKQAQGWLGQSIEFYLDDDPIWRELAEVPGDERLKFLDTHWQRVPIAFRLEADDADRLQQFMPALKSFLASSFLNLSVWETFTYREQECVRVGPTPEAAKQQPYLTHFGLFLAATPEALIVTPSKELLKRAIDRRLDHPPAERADPTSTARRPWLGSSMALQLTPREWALLLSAVNSDYRWTMQFRSWSNLPILNEWKRRYGDQDPVELHERHWHTRLVCPGGGQYVWNDEWQTMESTVYGHPAAPRAGPAEPPNFQGLRQADFGITFEEHGLRARVEIVREP